MSDIESSESSEPLQSSEPLLVAHRAGNRPAPLARAVAAGADFVELDVWFHRGRVEVGHEKTLGPLPVLWDRWSLALGRRRPLLLDDVLPRIPRQVAVYYDLKGTDARLPAAVRALADAHRSGEPRIVSSQTWPLLHPFERDALTRVLRSVGSAQMLARLPAAQAAWPGAGVAVHAKLVTPLAVAEARSRAPLFFSWPINDAACADTLIAAGVNGVISDDYALLAALRARRFGG